MASISKINPLLSLLSDLKSGKAFPVYLIYGDDNYLVNDALHKIIDALLPSEDRELNLFFIDGEEGNQNAICELILTPPLLAGAKVVVVRNAEFLGPIASLPKPITRVLENMDTHPEKAVKQFRSLLKKVGWKLEDLQNDNWRMIPDSAWNRVLTGGELEQLENWLPRILEMCHQYRINDYEDSTQIGLEEVLRGGIPDGNYLILTGNAVDKRKSLYKAISEKGFILELALTGNAPGQREMAGDLSREFLGGMGKNLSPAAFMTLGKRTGFDLRKMKTELEKLASYSGDQTTIGETDVDLLVTKDKEDSIFALTSAVAERNAGKALNILKDLLDQGFHYLMIFTMLVREIRLLLQAKLLLKTGVPATFHPDMDYARYQKIVFPRIKEWGLSEGRNEIASLHPYVLYNALKNSAGFTISECMGFMEYLLKTDIALKTTGQDPELLLEKLVISLCSSRTSTSRAVL
jgi:DNA polymerase III subunit delta